MLDFNEHFMLENIFDTDNTLFSCCNSCLIAMEAQEPGDVQVLPPYV